MTTPKGSAMPLNQTTQTAVARTHPKHLTVMADRLKTDPTQLYQTLKQTVFKQATDTEFLALMVVANQYDLNPILKEVYAFPQKGGGIVPIVAVDGWTKIINRQEQLDGIEFEMAWKDEDKAMPFSCTCTIYKKNHSKPTKITEYYGECFRPTEPWKNMPCRMIRHKALIQCGRVAFGIAGIYDEDEARDIINVTSTTSVPPPAFIGPDEPAEDKDDAPHGAEMPAKANTVEGSTGSERIERAAPQMSPDRVSTPEPQPEWERPAESHQEPTASPVASPFKAVDPAALAVMGNDELLGLMQTKLKEGGCTGEQLTKWAVGASMVKEGKSWSEMVTEKSNAKLKSVLSRWEAIGPIVKGL